MPVANENKIAKHQHKEAFALMWYACEDCAHRERIWNSRDGVTPFFMGCPSCGNTTLYHSSWRDEYAPNHKLHIHQHFWRDGTPDEAEAIIRRRIERAKSSHVSPEDEADLIRKSRDGTTGEFPAGWPMLDEERPK